ncbi:phenazine antibiotic biosynthesis protein [Streptomyces sp. NPDC047002]|uniref:phenazine antibiotic biosynthesis protein n=1 Tax=Streptomyces sp. NPDC047002 TaxID=3155475 RepID=UPI0034522092
MSRTTDDILDVLDPPPGAEPDPDAFVRAAMAWHFGEDTGSPFWLARAASLGFDPRTDVRGHQDLALFPNVADELRDVRAAALVPRGYGARPGVVGVAESGGTTGAPKRVVILRDWWDRVVSAVDADLDALGFPRGADWLALAPTGPHMVGDLVTRLATDRGGIRFPVDLDPRWIKKLLAAGDTGQADAYGEHLVEQAAHLLSTQDIGVLMTTPALLERLARRDDLVELVNAKVRGILWGGTHMDADSRDLYRTEVFPGVPLHGVYGSTMILGGVGERLGLTADDPCVFDPLAPFVTFSVVAPETGGTVGHGERGQVVTHHVSKSFLLPANLERDLATRVRAPAGAPGDAIADVGPVAVFDERAVIEGVY